MPHNGARYRQAQNGHDPARYLYGVRVERAHGGRRVMGRAYETDIELAQRRASGEPGPRVPMFAPSGRAPRIGQLRSLEHLDAALASGESDADRIAQTAEYAARANAQPETVARSLVQRIAVVPSAARLAEIRAAFLSGREEVRGAFGEAANPRNSMALEEERFQHAEQLAREFNGRSAHWLAELLGVLNDD